MCTSTLYIRKCESLIITRLLEKSNKLPTLYLSDLSEAGMTRRSGHMGNQAHMNIHTRTNKKKPEPNQAGQSHTGHFHENSVWIHTFPSNS